MNEHDALKTKRQQLCLHYVNYRSFQMKWKLSMVASNLVCALRLVGTNMRVIFMVQLLYSTLTNK